MSKTKVFSMHLLLLVLLVSSCSRKEETLYEPGKGGVRIDLTTELPATRAELDTVANPLNVEDFKVEILNSKGVIFKRWNTYAEYKSGENAAFHMNAGGPYTLRATYGDSLASGWSAWFFKGEQVFEVKPQQTAELSVTCRMANVKVAVAYGENLQADYQDYKATVSNSRGRLVFEKDRAEAGYIPVGTLTVDMELTDASGKKWYFRSGEVSAAAGDYITLNLDTKQAPQGSLDLTLSVDYSTNDKTVEVGITDAFLPAEKPVLSLTGFDAESGQLSFVESNDPDEASVTLTWDPKASPVKSLKLKSESEYFKEHGLPAEVDFCSLTSTDRDLLLNAGLLFPEMSGEMTANMVKLEFDGLAPKLEYDDDEAANTHTFTIEATDSKDNVVTKTVTIVPIQASKSLSEIQPGNVWARRAYLTLNTDGDPSKLTVQVKENGTELWYTPEGTEYSVSGKTSSATVKGLKSNTAYAFRAVYNGFAAAESQDMTTEAEQQPENASFEEWSESTVKLFTNGDKEQQTYYPWKTGGNQWWDTNNSLTAKSWGTVDPDLANWFSKQTYKSFPMVSYVPGRNGFAAQMMLIAVSSSATGSTAPFPIIGLGKIFTGVYEGEQGRSFPSRPDILKFWYKYESVNSDNFTVYISMKNGDIVIGEGTFTSSESKTEWVECAVDITYNRTDLVADTIYIEFVSASDTEKWKYANNIGDIVYGGDKTADVHRGSILTIDDLELIYE